VIIPNKLPKFDNDIAYTLHFWELFVDLKYAHSVSALGIQKTIDGIKSINVWARLIIIINIINCSVGELLLGFENLLG
jgi:hypothetical protein